MSQDPLNRIECPSHEQLSAYFDKESKVPEEMKKHLENCESCRNYLESLARLDYSLKHAVHQTTGSNSEISKRILVRVKASVKEETVGSKFRRFLPGPVLWRAAVLLMIGCGVCYLLWDESRQAKREIIAEGVQKSAYVPASFSSVPSRAVQIDELETIHFSADGKKAALKNGMEALPISHYVRHVWSIPEKPLLPLSALLKKNNIPESALSRTEKGMSLSCELNKLQSVRLIRACSEAGYRLLSPDQPQPEQRSFSGKPDEKIRYRAEFIESK